MVGQGLWCLAHTLWMGSSVSLVSPRGSARKGTQGRAPPVPVRVPQDTAAGCTALLPCRGHTCRVPLSAALQVASLGLMAHHLFGCWHGDRRLQAKYGEVRVRALHASKALQQAGNA